MIVSGWKELPIAGDEILQGKEADVKRAVQNRLRKASFEATIADAEAINASRRLEREEREKQVDKQTEESSEQQTKSQSSSPKELRLVIKGDVSGSIEALAAAVESIGNTHATTKVVSTGVGAVTESDVMFAKASEGMSPLSIASKMKTDSPESHDHCIQCDRPAHSGSVGIAAQRPCLLVEHHLQCARQSQGGSN